MIKQDMGPTIFFMAKYCQLLPKKEVMPQVEGKKWGENASK